MPEALAAAPLWLMGLFALMLFIVACSFLYQSLLWTQQHASSVPIVGNPLAAMFNPVLAGIRGAAHGAEGLLQWALNAMISGFHSLVAWFTSAPLALLHALVAQVQSWANDIHNDLTNFKNWTGAMFSDFGSEMHSLFNAAVDRADNLYNQSVWHTDAVAQQLQLNIDQAKAEFDQQLLSISAELHHELTLLDGRLQALEQYARILAGLQGFEAATGTEFGALLGQTATLGSELSNARTQLETVLPLAGVAALGADAVLNLERVAKDPCYCMNAGAGAGLEARVAMLEIGNL